jgi:cell division protein FtsL|tara:strand:+ start:22 stop:327 length:306 start_codon:yes stop_codon:yes gene_type:complete
MTVNPKKNKSIFDFLFFFGLVTLSIVVLISLVTLKNECIFLRNEIYHLENIRSTHLNRVKMLSGNIKNLSRQDRIEEIASANFQLHIPSPESLIVYIGDTE